MRSYILPLFLLICSMASGQSFSEKITKEFSFEKRTAENALMVANINGNVTVTGYDGDKILVEVNKTIRGKTQARVDRGKLEVQLGIIDRADTIILFIEDGCNTFGKAGRGKNNRGWNQKGWTYNWNCNNGDCDQGYDYKMDFTVLVPRNVSILVSTINDGNVSVAKVDGAVKANNINGSIKLVDLMREADASTINGDVDIEYTMNPKKECRFYSLNGDINAYFQKGLAANMSFESFNGDFYTNIEKIETLPVEIQRSESDAGLKYKINGNRYQIGSGGVFLDFETFNGNVYLKEK